jgi:hypothetical protein
MSAEVLATAAPVSFKLFTGSSVEKQTQGVTKLTTLHFLI